MKAYNVKTQPPLSQSEVIGTGVRDKQRVRFFLIFPTGFHESGFQCGSLLPLIRWGEVEV